MNKLISNLPDKVYHGTISIYKDSLVNGINIKRCNDFVDFGKGFYTTTNYEQARSFAIRNAKKNNLLREKKIKQNSKWIPKFAKPMVVLYNVDRSKLSKLNGYYFKEPNEKWAEFVFNNRMGLELKVSEFHNIDEKFDFIYGSMADAQIATLVEDVRLGKIKFRQFCDAIEPFDRYNQDQLSFHTRISIECLSLNDFIIL